MRNCFQSKGQDMLQHGEAVRDKYLQMLGALRVGELPAGWRCPTWLTAQSAGLFLDRLPRDSVMAYYHLYHDCGKPQVRAVDEQGRPHFPGHAEASARVWRQNGGCEEVAQLIAQDMDVHLLKAEDVPEFAARPTAPALLLTGLAEVHANALMFGGQESPSFKAKLKHLERRGRAVVLAWAQAGRVS